MSSSLVSGPYASAVSIKFTPSSTARLRTFSALARSGGQPQMPSPVSRIAPNPRRLTVRSPPNFQVGFVATLGDVDDSAPKITSNSPAKNAAPVNSVVPRNVRRVTPAFAFEFEDFSRMSVQRTSSQIAVNETGLLIGRARSPSAPNRFVIRGKFSSSRALEQRMPPRDLCRRLECLLRDQPWR